MAMRMGLSVGSTTDVSSLEDQVKRFRPRSFKIPNEEKAFDKSLKKNPSHEPLTAKCIKVIVQNFERLPVCEGSTKQGVGSKFMRHITDHLSLDLDPQVGALYVFDENYWKRRCIEQLGWQACQLIEHGLSWKQMFFETHVAQRIENFRMKDEKESFDDLLAFLRSCQDYVFSMKVKQLLSHPNMQAVCEALPNLATLDVTYGVKSIGMKYERMLFGMKISDASTLGKAIQFSENLVSLIFQSNLIDDDLLRMLMTGLIRNSTITYLDLSHNKITNHGARLLSKLLGENSVLTSLNLADNQIHAEGGRYLGRALRSNTALLELNLRLNRLTDEGGRMLLEGLRDGNTLTSLNLSGSCIGRESCTVLSILLREQDKKLAVLDLSCNELQDDDMHLLSVATEQNDTLISIDLRMNDVSAELSALEEIEAHVHRNELQVRGTPEYKGGGASAIVPTRK